METKTDKKTDQTIETPTIKPRHIVENNRDGTPKDTALCGFLWDRLNVAHNGSICQECVDIQKTNPRWS